MNHICIIATLLMSTFIVAQAETTVTVEPVNYLQLQREMKLSAHSAAAQAERMVHRNNPKASQKLQAAVNETLDRAARLSMALPYETLNSTLGNQLVLNASQLAKATHEAVVYLKQPPPGIQPSEYIYLLNKIQDLCQELAE